jgi:hypothetical protein
MQKLINKLYRHPISAFKRYQRFGGYFEYQKMLYGSRLMEKASLQLPPIPSFEHGFPVYFLTGKNYLYQTLFCIQSLVKVTGLKFLFILVDDGTLDNMLLTLIVRLLPGARVVAAKTIEQNLGQKLPAAVYPNLTAKRKVYPHLKKLTDIHTLDGADWKLVMDSDMLFWRYPAEVITWLKNPQKPIHMLDCVESYGYSKPLMEQLCGDKLPDLINVGIVGLNSAALNWGRLDKWIFELESKEGGSYYLEQALTAMLLGSQQSIVLNQEDYKVNPQSLMHERNILHHYVNLSKKIYFMQAWKHMLSSNDRG